MAAVKHDDHSMALDFVDYAALVEHSAYVSLDMGKVYWTSDSNDVFDEEIPDDLVIPHKNDLDPGKTLALRFVAQELPGRYAHVEGFLRLQGA